MTAKDDSFGIFADTLQFCLIFSSVFAFSSPCLGVVLAAAISFSSSPQEENMVQHLKFALASTKGPSL